MRLTGYVLSERCCQEAGVKMVKKERRDVYDDLENRKTGS